MRAAFVALLVCLNLFAGSGYAQDSGDYTTVIKQAVAEFDAGNWLEARILFQRAHSLNPNARTFRSLGLTAFELRRYVDAISELEAALADSRKPLPEKARTEVTQLLQRARAFVAVFRLDVQPAGAEVTVDGQIAKLHDGQLLLDPGSHTLLVRAPGYIEERQSLKIDEPRRETLSIELKVVGEAAPEEVATSESAQAQVAFSTSSNDHKVRPRLWTWVLGGAAVAAAGAGLGFGLAASSKHDDYMACDSKCAGVRDKGQNLQLGANISYGLSGALLAGAITAFFLEGKRSTATEAPKTAFYVSPWGAGVNGRF